MRPLLALLIALSSAVSAQGVNLEGRVVGITDGDTITLLDAEQRQHNSLGLLISTQK